MGSFACGGSVSYLIEKTAHVLCLSLIGRFGSPDRQLEAHVFKQTLDLTVKPHAIA